MRPITTTTSLAPTAVSFAQRSYSYSSSSWHSPIPYLFGGLAAMFGLIAFALLILACSYWRLSGQNQEEENRTGEEYSEKEGDSVIKESVKVYEEKILVIMAGDQNPTYLATPVSTKSSSLNDDAGGNHNNSLQNHHETAGEKMEEKEMEEETHLQPPQSQHH